MKDKAFVDTNILVYLYSEDEAKKRMLAYDAIEKYDCITSTQALTEFTNVCIKKLHIRAAVISNSIDEITAACTVVPVEQETIKKALELHGKYGYSCYDCLIIASALTYNCTLLLTEDLKNRHVIENRLTICNIFSE
ncbi:MAG: PIN domain-containing protein [Prevotellaceae bacterium]|jgi:predicted nucleic acid-binding protein|nr:PIN domain-containing protein [Prevotellaceae bacterium]